MQTSNVIALALLAACAGTDEEDLGPVEHAIVSSVLAPCVNYFGPTLCIHVQPDPTPTSTWLFGIEGYRHRWGIEQEIAMRREQLEQPVLFQTEHLVQVEVVAETPVPGPFNLQFPQRGAIYQNWFRPGFQLDLAGTAILCEPSICDEITAADAEPEPFVVTVDVVDQHTLRAIRVCAGPEACTR